MELNGQLVTAATFAKTKKAGKVMAAQAAIEWMKEYEKKNPPPLPPVAPPAAPPAATAGAPGSMGPPATPPKTLLTGAVKEEAKPTVVVGLNVYGSFVPAKECNK